MSDERRRKKFQVFLLLVNTNLKRTTNKPRTIQRKQMSCRQTPFLTHNPDIRTARKIQAIVFAQRHIPSRPPKKTVRSFQHHNSCRGRKALRSAPDTCLQDMPRREKSKTEKIIQQDRMSRGHPQL